MTRSKVVDGHAYPELLDGGERARRVDPIGRDIGLGDFDRELRGRHAMLRQRARDHGLEVRRSTDRLGADVDADAHRMSGAGPLRALAHRLANEPIRERHDESGLLREGNELRRWDQLAVSLPTHQRFESDDLATVYVC